MPVISPRQMDSLHQSKEKLVIKRYLTPMNNQKDGDNYYNLSDCSQEMGLRKIIEEEKMKCDGLKGRERMEEDQKTLWLDLEKRLKEMEREEGRKQMKMSINIKRVYSFHIY